MNLTAAAKPPSMAQPRVGAEYRIGVVETYAIPRIATVSSRVGDNGAVRLF